ncbi:MAG: putative zinc-binding metallopeptidase, partial [Rhodoferax sp.]
DHGLITLNMDEADDARREQVRTQMGESYRTLLGHFRHEVGHYYWDRLVVDTPWLIDYRTLFGDERADYAAALKHHYEEGPPADWAQRYVSTYASTHPWEDWAETWAHYLHMVDTLGTAMRFGLDAGDVELPYAPFTREALWRPEDPSADSFLKIANAWVELTGVLNEMSRSMGEQDFYPFVLTPPVVAKLQFIHCVVLQARQLPST